MKKFIFLVGLLFTIGVFFSSCSDDCGCNSQSTGAVGSEDGFLFKNNGSDSSGLSFDYAIYTKNTDGSKIYYIICNTEVVEKNDDYIDWPGLAVSFNGYAHNLCDYVQSESGDQYYNLTLYTLTFE